MNKMNIKLFEYKIKLVQKVANLLGVKAHVYQPYSKEKTIDTDDIESPNDVKQYTSVPERQIGD